MPQPSRCATRTLLTVLLVAVAGPALAQAPGSRLWTDIAEPSSRPSADQRVTTPSAYRLVQLDAVDMAARLGAAPQQRGAAGSAAGGAALQIPLPDGGFADVRVVESSVMAPELQAAHPEIRTYLAQGEGAVSGRLSLTPAGFRGMLVTPQGTVYVDPYTRGDAARYVVYYAHDLQIDPALRGRIADEVHGDATPAARRPNGATFRTYRLAVAATGEYTAFQGGTKALALAGIVTTVNRVTGIYERELSIRFVLIARKDEIVYLDGATDPYTNARQDSLISENPRNLRAVLGDDAFDIGHVFSTSPGGVAGLGVVCAADKAAGVTGTDRPVGDAFDVDYVAHEIGHQFGGTHTFNGTQGGCSGANRNAPTAFEPGSGSTILGYAGICGTDENLQNNTDPYFHSVTLDQIAAYTTAGDGATCGASAPTNNTIPTVTTPAGFTIPAGTPFALTGAATDDTPASLTYAWEEFDLGPGGLPGSVTKPFFRSFTPTASPTRFFPQLTRLVAGLDPVRGERLPTDAQTLSFRLTARDNRATGGAVNSAMTTVTVDAASGPFAVTFASTPSQTFNGTATVTWAVAGTNAGAVNTPTVDILLSTNNGETFQTVLLAATPNDGSETVTFPVATTQGRIMVRAVGNVFFNVNPQPFTATVVTANEDAGAAAGLALEAPRPNPARGRVSVGFTLPEAGVVRLSVVDLLGREVAVLAAGERAAGPHAEALDTARLAPGVYAVRLAASGQALTQRLVVVR